MRRVGDGSLLGDAQHALHGGEHITHEGTSNACVCGQRRHNQPGSIREQGEDLGIVAERLQGEHGICGVLQPHGGGGQQQTWGADVGRIGR